MYIVSIMDKSFEGILDVMFSYRSSEYEFVVFSCYLAHENSTRGHKHKTSLFKQFSK
jgi:hypothetical protein